MCVTLGLHKKVEFSHFSNSNVDTKKHEWVLLPPLTNKKQVTSRPFLNMTLTDLQPPTTILFNYIQRHIMVGKMFKALINDYNSLIIWNAIILKR